MKRIDKVFWILFSLFCFASVVDLKLFHADELSRAGRGGAVILVIALLLCGLAIRRFVYKNYDRKNDRFKIG